MKKVLYACLACMLGSIVPAVAQSILHRADSILAQKYRKGDIDTAYIVRTFFGVRF